MTTERHGRTVKQYSMLLKLIWAHSALMRFALALKYVSLGLFQVGFRWSFCQKYSILFSSQIAESQFSGTGCIYRASIIQQSGSSGLSRDRSF